MPAGQMPAAAGASQHTLAAVKPQAAGAAGAAGAAPSGAAAAGHASSSSPALEPIGESSATILSGPLAGQDVASLYGLAVGATICFADVIR